MVPSNGYVLVKYGDAKSMIHVAEYRFMALTSIVGAVGVFWIAYRSYKGPYNAKSE